MGSASFGTAATLAPGAPLDYRFDFSPPRTASGHDVFIDFVDNSNSSNDTELTWSVGLTRGGADFPASSSGELRITQSIGSALSTLTTVTFTEETSTAFVRLSITGGTVGIERVVIFDGNSPNAPVVATAPVPLPAPAALLAAALAAIGVLRRKRSST